MGDSSVWGWAGSRLLATGTNDPDTQTEHNMTTIPWSTVTIPFPTEVYANHAGPYVLHRRTSSGVYHLMGDYETDYVHYAFRDCVSNHTDSYVWVTDVEGITLENYDKDHDDYLNY